MQEVAQLIAIIGGCIIGTIIFKNENRRVIRFGSMQNRFFGAIGDWLFCAFIGTLIASAIMALINGAFMILIIIAIIGGIVTGAKKLIRKHTAGDVDVEDQENGIAEEEDIVSQVEKSKNEEAEERNNQ